GFERSGSRSPRDRLQDRGLYLQITPFIKELTDTVGNLGPFDEVLLYTGIYYQIHVPLPEAQLRIVEFVENVSLGIFFWQGQGTEGLAQQGKLLYKNGLFS